MNRREAIKALVALPTLERVVSAQPRTGDVIVAECMGLLTVDEAARLKDTLHQIWPKHRVLVVDESVRLKFWTEHDAHRSTT